ncbi:MAG: PHP domain-containing protein [Syntrophaceae bacterium]|nr:PHP domain-containing protein [Syntrophaceae bacterium]
MLKAFRCDLHVHTCLSPCAELDMYPRKLVERCLSVGLDAVAICDHNASENIVHVRRCAEGTPLTVLAGMEVASREEVHLLALFDMVEELLPLQEWINRHLPGRNDERLFGCQAIVNDRDEVEGFCERLLIGATELPLQAIVEKIHDLGGLAVASHIDRESFSILSQLGFVVPGPPFDALEISPETGIREGRLRYPELEQFSFITSSDAHYIRDIGRAWTDVKMNAVTVKELSMAFRKREGRTIEE